MPQRDSMGYTVGVALALCIVCAFFVSAAAVALKDRQELNQQLDRQRNILDATGIAYDETGEPASELNADQIAELFERFEVRLVDLETGEYVDDIDQDTYDARKAAKDPDRSVKLSGDLEYSPGVDRREKVARVYFLKDEDGQIQQVVLPVYGKGLWSTLYGYLAVRRDLATVQGLVFYEHGETPGLGGEVDNPNWKAQWQGVKLYDDGDPAAGVAKGPAPADNDYLVDGLSGATITCRGVTNLIRYWIGENGFGPYLSQLEKELEQGTTLASTDAASEEQDGQE